jgi:hypothetical protein
MSDTQSNSTNGVEQTPVEVGRVLRTLEVDLARLREELLGIANTAASLVDRADQLRREITGEPREYSVKVGF